MPELKCIAKVRRIAESVGATMNSPQAGDEIDIIVDSPKGYVWDANGCRGIYVPFKQIGARATYYADACREAIWLMEHGLTRVDAETQATIEYDFDEDWTPPPNAPETIEVGRAA